MLKPVANLMPFRLSGRLFWKIFVWFGLAWVLIISVVVVVIGFNHPEWLLNQPRTDSAIVVVGSA
jgi:hypothetical protein